MEVALSVLSTIWCWSLSAIIGVEIWLLIVWYAEKKGILFCHKK